MRPLTLKIAGLHSFRERQEIDFRELCQGGVFGIFGPTGSGKSSILDAITLALFGKVERAERNTIGIMNHGEHSLSVSFEFLLSGASGEKRYLVERSYKRSDDLRLRPASSRLVEITQEDLQVLADKPTEVTNRIEEILGLTAEDFTRAVVLPQGKFAEFLTLEGKARRQMLERLFGLEKYGNRLAEKLKARKEEAEGTVKEIKAEQQGLGDCSPAALLAAKSRLDQAVRDADEKRKMLLAKEREMESKRQVWQWQQEKERLDAEYEEMLKQEESVRQLELLLQKAEQAESLRPYLEELHFSEKEKEHWQQQVGLAESLLQKTRADYEVHRKALDEARERRSLLEPQLAVRMESYKEALQLHRQLVEMEKVLTDRSDRLARTREELKSKESEKLKAQSVLEKALARQVEIKSEMEKKRVKGEERLRIADALQAKQRLSYLQKEWNHIKTEIKEKEESLRHTLQNLQFYQTAEREWHEKSFWQINKIWENFHLLTDIGRKVQQTSTINAAQYQKKKDELAASKERRLAEQLVLRLKEGERCPVCGSTHHPHPAKAEQDEDIHQLGNELVQLEAWLAESKDLQQEIAQLKFTLEQLSKRLYESMEEEYLKEKELAAGAEPFFAELFPHPGGDVPAGGGVAFRDQLADIARKAALLEEENKQIIAGLAQISQKRSEFQVLVASGEQQIAELKRKEEGKSEECRQQLAEWQSAFPEYPFEEIEQLQSEIRQRDREMEELQERLAKSIPFIEELEGRLKSLEQAIRELERHSLQLEAELSAQTKSLAEQKNRIDLLTSGEEPQSLLKQVTAQLEQLKETEEQNRRAYEQSEADLRQAENQYWTAFQSANLAQQRFISAVQKWERALQSTIFRNKTEVEASITPRSTQAEWKMKIEGYRDTLKVMEAKRLNLAKLLDGAFLTPEEWNRLEQEMMLAKQEDEAALQAKARAERDYQEIIEKSLRWEELEKRRLEAQRLLDRLLQLQTVFRGNAFVDFLAEEQLHQITLDASRRLGRLTRGRYAIEVDSEGGFIMRDDANGGVKRPVTTLSGGETFLTSLALALSLSAQIQLRGQYPLQFFFLDEGFGTLDQDLLETVINALERLQGEHMSIGVISHVPELKERIPRRLIVSPAEPTGRGSTVKIEVM